MENNLVQYILFFTGLGLFAFFLVKVGNRYWSLRLNKWATEQGLRLIEFTGAKFYEGPSAWRRSENLRVLVEDKQGQRRRAWVMFDIYWGFTFGTPLTNVIWEDAEQATSSRDLRGL